MRNPLHEPDQGLVPDLMLRHDGVPVEEMLFGPGDGFSQAYGGLRAGLLVAEALQRLALSRTV